MSNELVNIYAMECYGQSRPRESHRPASTEASKSGHSQMRAYTPRCYAAEFAQVESISSLGAVNFSLACLP